MALNLNFNKKGKKKKKKSLHSRIIKLALWMSAMSMGFRILIISIFMGLIFTAAAGMIQFFQGEDDVLEKEEINWDLYQCSCTFLSQAEIDRIKAGGEVNIGINNSGSLNVSGGSVANIDGLVIPSQGSLIDGTNQYGIPILDGYSRADTGKDIIVGVSKDTRVESKIYTDTDGNHTSATQSISELAKNAKVTTEKAELPVRVDGNRLALAVGSGLLAWPDDPDRSDTITNVEFDVVLKNGHVIPGIVKDAKANVHTGEYHIYHCGGKNRDNIPAEKRRIDRGELYHAYDNSFIELIVGDSGATSFLRDYIASAGGIDHVKVYDYIQGSRTEEVAKGMNPYAFSSLNMTSAGSTSGTTGTGGGSTSSSDTTTSFGQSGSGATVNNSDIISGLSAEKSQTANTIYQLLVGKYNYSPAAALGVMGNMWQESGFEPQTWSRNGGSKIAWENPPRNGTYFGLVQTNKDNFVAWVPVIQGQGLSPNTAEGQLFGLNYTLSEGGEKGCFNTYPSSNYKISYDEFKQLTDPVLACDYFMTAYERATGGEDASVTGQSGNLYQHLNKRKEYTRTLMAHFGISGEGTGGGSSSSGGSTLKYTNGQKISLDPSWTNADKSEINTGSATYYTATSNRNNICIAVNAGHGCTGGGSKQTLSHPDGTPKVTGGTTAAGAVYSTAISSGMNFSDGTSEASVNLKIALAMKTELLNKGYDVLMIRETDNEQLDNIARTVISNQIADAHLAIHFDGTTTDKGAFYMSVPNVESYRNMSPVKETWQLHNEFGESLIRGLDANEIKIADNKSMEMDLTQTSYSSIPSIDIELGDKITDHSDAACAKFATGLILGIDDFFTNHPPMNQANRGGISTGGGTEDVPETEGTINSGSVINAKKENLRTACSMKTEGICGCYVSDPQCACHIFAGSDGILGTEDDANVNNAQNTINNSLQGYTTEQQLIISEAKETMQIYMDALKASYPDKYEKGWDSSKDGENHGNGWWYGQTGGSILWTVPFSINGKTYNTRQDCSSYMNSVLVNMGATWANPTYGTGTMRGSSYKTSIIADDRFIYLDYDKAILQPGDIVVKTGHTEMVCEIVDPNTNTYRRYSWGGTSSVRLAWDVNTRTLLDVPDVSSYNYYNNNYKSEEFIIRYVGSGGAGR